MPDPQIFIDVGLDFLISFGAGALWEGIKELYKRRRTPKAGNQSTSTTINLSVSDGSRSLVATVATDDEAIARQAFESFGQAIDLVFTSPQDPPSQSGGKKVLVWNQVENEWKPPR